MQNHSERKVLNMHEQISANIGNRVVSHSDEELIDTLTAISVVAKQLARKLQALSDQEKGMTKGGKSHGKNERTVHCTGQT